MTMWRANELLPEDITKDVREGLFFLGEHAGEPAGTIKFQLSDLEFWPDVPEKESAFIHRLAVRRRFAGGTVSSALLSWALERTACVGRRYLRLDCEASRYRLRAVYERFGFQHHSDRQVGPYFVSRYEFRLPSPSVRRMWEGYLAHSGELATPPPEAWHFCDNEVDADTCALLVVAGRKRATAPSLWFFESRGLTPPVVGELNIVTNWSGVAQCIIRTTAVQIVRFSDVTVEHAMAEGEGDGSLAFWRATHWEYYKRELVGTGYVPMEDMPVVCQYFERVYP